MCAQERIRLHSVHTPRFLVSPIVEGLHAFDLVALSDEWGEGFDPWVYETRSNLSERQFLELSVCNCAIPWSHLLSALCREAELGLPFDWLIERLTTLGDDEFMGCVDEEFRGAVDASSKTASAASVRATLALRDSQFANSESYVELLTTLLRSPATLKRAYLKVLEWFLDEHMLSRWNEDRPALEAEVNRRNEHRSPGTLQEWVQKLTGRSVSYDAACASDRELIAMPTRLLGPFVTLSQISLAEESILLLYGYRGEGESAEGTSVPAFSAVSGFKALGEDTRYRILQMTAEREMYAVEIGLHFTNVGQPAVSRHLRYLAAEGLLHVRDAQAKKFYSLNGDRICHLRNELDRLSALAATRLIDPQKGDEA